MYPPAPACWPASSQCPVSVLPAYLVVPEGYQSLFSCPVFLAVVLLVATAFDLILFQFHPSTICFHLLFAFSLLDSCLITSSLLGVSISDIILSTKSAALGRSLG